MALPRVKNRDACQDAGRILSYTNQSPIVYHAGAISQWFLEHRCGDVIRSFNQLSLKCGFIFATLGERVDDEYRHRDLMSFEH
jgi:hypothetical protein